ncbi:hypothetical protein V6N12_029809 [Hibiscus sabdariffa]|uniref:Uncharacterized protein n=1 Tax=Hibiscus sabdariffa TaxID=183260 RepID=A0ABR2CX78_9ROSI
MKDAKKYSEIVWGQIQMRSSPGNPIVFGQSTRPISKLMILFVSITNIIYILKLITTTSDDCPFTSSLQQPLLTPSILNETAESTSSIHRHREV